MKQLMMFLMIAGALMAAPEAAAQQREVGLQTVRDYLDRMKLSYVAHPKNPGALVVTRTAGNEKAERIDLYIEPRRDNTLVLTAYARAGGRYFNTARAASRARLMQRLLQANHRAFATFFVDEQGDIGARFTFTTENGVGFEAFRVAVTELLRIADQYTPILDGFMRKT